MEKINLNIFIFLMIILFYSNSANADDKCDVSFLIEHQNSAFEPLIHEKIKEKLQNLSFDCAKKLSNKSVELDKMLYEAGFPSLIYIIDEKELWSSLSVLLETGEQFYFRKDPDILSRLQRKIEEGAQLQKIYDFISAAQAPSPIAADDKQKQFYSYLDYLLFFPVYNETLANKFLNLCEIYNCSDSDAVYGNIYKIKIDFIKGYISINDLIDKEEIPSKNVNALFGFLDKVYSLRMFGLLQSNCSLQDKVNLKFNTDKLIPSDFICGHD